MAKFYGKSKGKANRAMKKSKAQYAKNLTSFAYKMGLVQRGLNAGDTKVADAYNKGKEKSAPVKTKPLY